MAAPSLTWKDLGILKDALDEFERTLEDLGIEAGEVSLHTDGRIRIWYKKADYQHRR